MPDRKRRRTPVFFRTLAQFDAAGFYVNFQSLTAILSYIWREVVGERGWGGGGYVTFEPFKPI